MAARTITPEIRSAIFLLAEEPTSDEAAPGAARDDLLDGVIAACRVYAEARIEADEVCGLIQDLREREDRP